MNPPIVCCNPSTKDCKSLIPANWFYLYRQFQESAQYNMATDLRIMYRDFPFLKDKVTEREFENIFKTIQDNYENLEIIYPTNEFNYKLNGNDEK